MDFSVVLNQPHRRYAGKDAKSELLGYALGRLRFNGEISEDQLRAGNEWAQLVKSFMSDQGLPMGSPRSGSLLSDAGKVAHSFKSDGGTHDAERQQNHSVSLSGRYNECLETMKDLGQSLGTGGRILSVMRKVCIDDRNVFGNDVGDLRYGLNAMARVFKIG